MTAKTIEEYISTYPDGIKEILEKIRQTISESAPGAEESISYGIPTFNLNGNLVHFAAARRHIGFYPAPSAIEAFAKKLEPFDTSKGTIKFPLDKPIPFTLIKDIVKFRVEENSQKSSR